MKNDWNKYIYPESFHGFIDASSHQYNGPLLNAFGEQRGENLVNLSQQAEFDGQLLDISLLSGLYHHQHVWGKVSYEQLRYYFTSEESVVHHQIYVELNLDEISSSASINRCAELLEYFIDTGEVSIRLLLKNAFQISQSQLIKIVRMCELSGVQRICFNDDLSLFSPSGIKRFLAALNATNYSKSLEFECAFSGVGFHTKENAIMAITSGINYIHVTASYLELAYQALPVTLLMQAFSNHNEPLNKQALQRYIMYLHGLTVDDSSLTHIGADTVNDDVNRGAVANMVKNNSVPEVELSNNIAIRFDVSANDWHVKMQLMVNGVIEELGERVHHYVLLLLAREYYQQYQTMLTRDGHVDPLLVGWVEREALHQMIGDNEAQFNVKLCRAKKHIIGAAEKLGYIEYQPLSTRQGAIRLNCGNVTVVQGSKIEFEMENWQFIDSHYTELKQA